MKEILPEKELVKKILDSSQMVVGETWYLLNAKWWESWKSYIGFEEDSIPTSTPPGAVDNHPLLEGDKLKPGLLEKDDYIIIPKRCWTSLVNRYSGGPEIARKVISVGIKNDLMVEVYLLELKIFKKTSQSNVQQMVYQASKNSLVKDVIHQISADMYLPPFKTRLWTEDDEGSLRLLNRDDTLFDARLYDGSKVIVETQLSNNEWPHDPPSLSSMAATTTTSLPTRTIDSNIYSSNDSYPHKLRDNGSNGKASSSVSSFSSTTSSPSSSSMFSSPSVSQNQRGVCGLSNLGNTCFMNSALQCLTHTAPLIEYFLQDKYKDEINTTNPLGMGGKIAQSYGELLKRLWDGRWSSISPTDFKYELSRFAPQFSGYRQHDSQELLAFLLDGLHEDLNRVLKKPFVEMKEAAGRPDEVVATEAWDNHLIRNKSVIVDTFMGQYKSTLVCPECGKVSITFDPFMYLSLPLPPVMDRTINVSLRKSDGSHVKTYGVTVSKQSKVAELKENLSRLCGVSAKELFIVESFGSRLVPLEDPKSVKDIRDYDIIYAYQKQGPAVIQVTHKITETKPYTKSSICEVQNWISIDPTTTTNLDVYETLWKQLKPFVIKPSKEDDEEGSGGDGDTQMADGEEDESYVATVEKWGEAPFVLKSTNRTSSACGVCMAFKYCSGCPIHPDKQLVKVDKTLESYAVIEWNMKFFDDKEFRRKERDVSADRKPGEEATINLRECLDLFLSVERLGQDDLWHCPDCKEFKQATKKFDLWALPQILVIHLKRFQYSKYHREKIDTFVDFPIIDFDLSTYVLGPKNSPAIYDLYAISNHMGGLAGGHYTAYALNHLNNKWYSFNDSSAHEVDGSNIKSSAAYVLFYQRRGGGGGDGHHDGGSNGVNGVNGSGKGKSTTNTTTTTTTTTTEYSNL